MKRLKSGMGDRLVDDVDQAELLRRLRAAERQADEYKQQLERKEQEAETYKKQLQTKMTFTKTA